MKRSLFFIFVFAAPAMAMGQTTVRYADRSVDLSPYVPRESIIGYRAQAGTPVLFIRQRTGGAIRLRAIPLTDLPAASTIDPARTLNLFGATDYAKQHAVPRLDTLTGAWFVRGDTANDEHFDIFEMQDGRATARRLTRNAGVWNLWPQGGRIVYSHWLGNREPRAMCLTVIDSKTLKQKRVLCTDSTTSFTPAVTWRQDAGAFVQPVRMAG